MTDEIKLFSITQKLKGEIRGISGIISILLHSLNVFFCSQILFFVFWSLIFISQPTLQYFRCHFALFNAWKFDRCHSAITWSSSNMYNVFSYNGQHSSVLPLWCLCAWQEPFVSFSSSFILSLCVVPLWSLHLMEHKAKGRERDSRSSAFISLGA